MPANRAYICRLRTDVPAGTLQLLDLMPNTSQRNLIYQPVGQSGYLLGRVQNDTVATTTSGGDDVTVAEYKGVAAYLLDHVEQGGRAAGTTAQSDANANAAAAAIIAIMDASGALTLTAVNAAIAGVVADTELTDAGGSASTGDLNELLKIMSGGEYTLPAGSVTETPTGTFDPTVAGSFTNDDEYRQLYVTGALQVSCGAGRLSGYAASTWTYGGTAGAALVVYDNDGNVLAP
jgi:hypothetical protein